MKGIINVEAPNRGVHETLFIPTYISSFNYCHSVWERFFSSNRRRQKTMTPINAHFDPISRPSVYCLNYLSSLLL